MSLWYNTPMPTSFELRKPNPLLIVISGPSGVGKDSVVQRMKERGFPFHFVVTATTRDKRENETNGKDYWFVSKAITRAFPNGRFAKHLPADRTW